MKANMAEIEPLIAPDEVAKLLRMTIKTLANWRSETPNRGPRCKKVGGRVLYPQSEVMAWLSNRDFDEMKKQKQEVQNKEKSANTRREKQILAISEERDALWRRIAELNTREEDLD